MHKTSYDHMSRLVNKYLDRNECLKVIDIGSYQYEGQKSYRELIDGPRWSYAGVDISKGPNVDVIMQSAYALPFGDDSVDLIVCGQVFEHVEFFWLTWKEMVRILKPGGRIFLIAPSRGFDHKYPVDCWRFYPDGYRALAKWGGLSLLEVHTDGVFVWPETDSLMRKCVILSIGLSN